MQKAFEQFLQRLLLFSSASIFSSMAERIDAIFAERVEEEGDIH